MGNIKYNKLFNAIAERFCLTYVVLFMLFLLVFLFDFVMSRNILMLTEGWWEYYAWLTNNGLKPYIDFPLKFPPLYVYLFSSLVSIFKMNFLSIRIFMAAVHCIEVYILYLWLRKYVGVAAACCGVAVATAMVMANPVYLVKDYHTIVALLVVSCVLCVELSSSLDKKVRFLAIVLSALLCALLLLIKQNIGLFFSLGVIFHWWRSSPRSKFSICKTYEILLFFCAFLVSLVVFSTVVNHDWPMIFYNNQSKGSPVTVLLRFITDKGCVLVGGGAAITVFFWYVANKIVRINSVFLEELSISNVFVRYVFVFLLVLLTGFSIKNGLILFSLSLAWVFIRRMKPSWVSSNLKNVNNPIVPLLAIAYCGTNTAGYNAVSMELLVALFVSEYVNIVFIVTGENFKKHSSVFIVLPLLLFFISILPKIGPVGYDWWGYKTGGIMLANNMSSEVPFDELKNIKTDRQTASMFEAISDVKSVIKPGEKVFSFPSIPLVYLLFHQYPIGSPVLWFDVSSGNDGDLTVSALKLTKPKFIFWLRPPKMVYVGHYKMRHSDPSLLSVDKWIIKNLVNKSYKITKVIGQYQPSDYSSETAGLTEKFEVDYSTCNSGGSMNSNNFFPTLDAGYEETKVNNNIYEVNSAFFNDFIKSKNCLIDTPRHVFYVLERID